MKTGELCETCDSFNIGRYSVTACPICGKDMCTHCANDFLCPTCFALKERGKLNACPIYEDGELVTWGKIKPIY